MKQASIIPLLKFKNQTLPFKVQSIQNFTEEQDELNELPHYNNYYEMIWLIRGRATLHVDMQEHIIENNTIFYLKPDQAHLFQADDKTEGFVFSFTDSYFRIHEYDIDWVCEASLSQLFAERSVINITCEMEEEMKEIALKMIREIDNQYTYSIDLLKRYFKIFLIHLTRMQENNCQSTEQSREAGLVKKFMELLGKGFKEKKQVAEYATQLLVTPNYLNKAVKKITGHAVGYHIRQRVVLEAKKMCRYTSAGMKEIAYSLGFEDCAHFSRFFKTFAGMKFSDFKKGGVVIPIELYNRA